MKKIILSLIICIFFYTSIFSQNNVKIGINSGGNISAIINDFVSENSNLGYQIGLNFEETISKNIILKSNLNYTVKSFNLQVDYTDEFGTPQGNIKVTSNYKFIALPVLIKYNFTKSKMIFVNTGINFDYLFNIKSKSSVNKDSNFKTSQLDLDFSLGVGTNIPINNNCLNLELRYNPYLINLLKPKNNIGAIKTNTLSLFTTWNFNL